jgi:phosphoribosylformimino-5-aminoimidazole carboxamide ribotide isomerase
MTFEILPAIDLRGGRVVRLERGDFTRETSYSEDPVATAVLFAGAGARWLHVVDLDGARSGTRAHMPVIAGIVAAVGDRVAVEIAGGLRDEPSVAQVFRAGATRVVIGTRAIEEPAFAGRLVSTHGADRVAAAIDVRGGRAVGRGWATHEAGVDAGDAIRRLADAGVSTFEVTAIERDGLLGGPDLALYERLARLEAGSIIASGGVVTLDDITAIRQVGAAGVIVGRAIYEGRLDLAAAQAMTTGTG